MKAIDHLRSAQTTFAALSQSGVVANDATKTGLAALLTDALQRDCSAKVLVFERITTLIEAARVLRERNETEREWCGYCDGGNTDHPCSCKEKRHELIRAGEAFLEALAALDD